MSDIDPAWLSSAFNAGVAQLSTEEDVRFSDHAFRDSLNLFLVAVADNLTARALATEEAKRRGWKTAAAELTTAAHHVGAYADAMRHFDPDAAVLVVGETSGDGAPLCASFRRATPGDEAVCRLDRGHEGDHWWADQRWPRKHSGAVCGDVITAGPLALNCELPLGHDGDEHWNAHDGAGVSWPRGVNPRPLTGPVERPDVGYPGKTPYCAQCDTDAHVCQGCGLPTAHDGSHACEHPDGSHYVAPVATIAGTDDGGTPDPLYPGACGDVNGNDQNPAPDTCMLPAGHTGIHIGRTGQRWARVEGVGEITVPADAMPGAAVVSITGGVASDGAAYVEVSGTMNSGEPLREYAVGDTVTVAGMEFVKISDNPFPPMDDSPLARAILGEQQEAAVMTLERPAVPAAGLGILTGVPVNHAERQSALLGAVTGLGIMTAAPTGPRSTPVGLIAPGVPRARQSVSSITTMEDCGLKYRFTYRDQLPQTPAWWNVGGTAFHETVRVIEDNLSEEFTAERDMLEQQQTAGKLFSARLAVEIDKEVAKSGVASQSWRAADKGKENGAWWRAAGDDMARLYVQQRVAWVRDWRLVKTLTGGTAQEIEFNHRFGAVELKGFIDDLWVHRTDPTRVAVRDLKAGKRPPESDFQLEVYGEVVKALPTELAFAAEPLKVVGAYYLARKGVDTAPVQLGGNAEIVTYRAEQVAAADAAGIFMPRPSSFCGSCPFRSKCPAVK